MNRPTVVVGVGAGGARMLSAVAERVGAAADPEAPDWVGERRIGGERFSFLAVDTDEGDLRAESPDGTRTVALEPPDANAERDYLAAPPAATEAGASLRRRRPLARLALESGGNIAAVRGAIETAMADCAALDGADDGIDVWLLAGLGGGIGGGGLPLTAALVADAAADVRVPVSTYAFGSVPAEGDDATTAIHARNAYVTTRELLALLPDGEGSYPVTLDLPLAETVLGRPELRLSEPPLSGLFLAAVDSEGRTNPVERAAATTVVGHALTEGRPDLPFDNASFGQEPGPPAFAATVGRVTLPADGLDRLFDLRARDRATEDQLGDLAERTETLETDIGWLDAMLDASGADERPQRLDESVFHYPQRRATDADIETLATGPIGLDTHIDSVVSEGGRAVPERVPTRAVVALVLCERLRARVDDAVASHPLRSRLETARSEYPDAVAAVLDGHGADDLPDDPVRAWREVLEPALSNRAAALSEESDDRLNPLASRRLRKRADAIGERAAELSSLADGHEALGALRETVEERADEAAAALRERRAELAAELDEAKRERDGLQETRRGLVSELDGLRGRLSTPRVQEDGLRRQVPLTNPVDLIPETLSFADSIAELVAEGFVDETAMATALVELAGALSDTVHEPDADGPSRENRIVMATARPNRWGPAGDLLALDPDDGPDVQATLADAFDDRIGVDDGRGFAVDFAALYAPVSLGSVRTLGALHDAFGDPSRSVSEVFPDLSDATVRGAIAYPELLPDGARGAKQREVAEAVADIDIGDRDPSPSGGD